MDFSKMILLLLVAVLPAHFVTADYTLTDSFTSANFNSEFYHFTDKDPTRGFVQYVDHTTAVNNGLKRMRPGSIYLGVDHSTVATKPGRQSVRMTSKKVYNRGLFVADIAHMPTNTCGVWPAFWLLGTDWPNDGEIDIVEGVNQVDRNSMTLHTSAGCSISRNGFSGQPLTSNCQVYPHNNEGCGVMDRYAGSYGQMFNRVGGGVYATEWTSSAIKIWFFSRSKVPHDVVAGTPDPSQWGMPSAQFAGECAIDSHFRNMQIVINTTFCGVWAGTVWDSTCSDKAPTCEDFVANFPDQFEHAYWSINSINVYQVTEENNRLYGVRDDQRS